MLKVENLTVKYSGITAVDGISFEVGQGETVAMIGANGAGKSTTLKAISALLKPASGHIWFEDNEITKTPASKIVEMGRRAKKRVAEEYTWDKICEQYENIWK